ncbi:MAG: choice-of-anchor L domain-containing protein [Flavobacteriales bacterium]
MRPAKLFIASVLLLATGHAISQVQVNSTLTPEQYVNDILLGNGIEAFNVQLTGSAVQIGHMTGGGPTPAPIAEGLILSSAQATNVSCATDVDVPFGQGVSGDASLLSVANSVPPLINQNFNVSAVNDICAIEFDFVASGDSIKFNYFFGSDEYLTWVNTSFNDVFAFFLSGPGITGPYSAPAGYPGGAVNIAILPETNPPLPITISSVNNVLNNQFYINNQGNTQFCQNGLTTLLTAEAGGLLCGETYHIKLAIADGSDSNLESIVVIEAGSFSSNSLAIGTIIPNAPPSYPALTLLEGCIDGTLIISRFETTQADTLLLTIGGTATSGLDFEPLPDSLFFEVGQGEISIPITTLFDTEVEDTETLTVSYEQLNSCGDTIVSSITLTIIDYHLPTLDLPDNLLLCNGETQVLSAVPSGGSAPFNFEWSTGTTAPQITVGQNGSQLITVNVTDYCGNSVEQTINVVVPDQNTIVWDFIEVNAPPGLPQNTLIEDCVSGLLTIARASTNGEDTLALTIGGTATNGTDYTTLPTQVIFADGEEVFTFEVNAFFDNLAEQQETIVITYFYVDGCGIEYSETLTLNVIDYSTPEIIVDTDLFLCNGEEAVVSGLPSGGYPPFAYAWSTGQSTANITVTGGELSEVSVITTDYCENESTALFTIEIPEPLIAPNDAELCFGGEIRLQPTGGVQPYVFDFPTDSIGLFEADFSPVYAGDYTITYTDQCGVSVSSLLEVFFCETEIPNIFTPNGDGINDRFVIGGSQGFPNSRLEVYNRWGGLVYEEDAYQNNWDARDVPDGVYFYIYSRRDGEKFSGTVTISR